jgi:tetratricopeptide (TPR) repeat protein
MAMSRFVMGLSAVVIVVMMFGCASKEAVSPSPVAVEPPMMEPSPTAEATPAAMPEEEAKPLVEEVAEGEPLVMEPLASAYPSPIESEQLAQVSPEDEGRYVDFMLEGFARHAAGDSRGAARSFLQALGVRPGSSEAHYNLAKAYKAGGENAALVTYELERAVEGEAMVSSALGALGAAYFRQRRFEDAERVFGRALSEYRTAENLSNLGAAQYMLEKYEEARAAFDEALKLEPERPECFWYLAKISTQAGEIEAAKGYWKKAIEAYGSASEWGRRGIEELNRLEKGTEKE